MTLQLTINMSVQLFGDQTLLQFSDDILQLGDGNAHSVQ